MNTLVQIPEHDFAKVLIVNQAVAAGITANAPIQLDANYAKCVGIEVQATAVSSNLATMSVFSDAVNSNVVDIVPVNIFDKTANTRFSPFHGVLPQNFPASGKQCKAILTNNSSGSVTYDLVVIFYLKK